MYRVVDVTAVSQMAQLEWVVGTDLVTLSRITQLLITGDISTMPQSFKLGIVYLFFCKLYRNLIRNRQWISVRSNMPMTRYNYEQYQSTWFCSD
jgi:hypothetical protein